MNLSRSTPLLAAVLLLFTADCSRNTTPKSTDEAAVRSRRSVAEVISVETRGEKVPNFTWKDSTGKTVDLDAYRGKVTLINFWATWCGPCRRELPDLVALSRELAGRDVRIIGVSTDRGSNVIDDVQSFVDAQGIPYQIVVANENLEEAFGNIRALPTSFVVDANGKIIQSFIGMRSKEFFAEALTAGLK
jgi:thiol-disulfide isomerase/thioredoxin